MSRLNRLQPPASDGRRRVKPGMTVAEIGAGRGRYVVHLRQGGREWPVYAEISMKSPTIRASRCRRWDWQCAHDRRRRDRSQTASGAVDLIFIISSYGHFSDPSRCCATPVRPQADGVLAIVEWLPRDGAATGDGSPQQIEAQLKDAGYRWWEPIRF